MISQATFLFTFFIFSFFTIAFFSFKRADKDPGTKDTKPKTPEFPRAEPDSKWSEKEKIKTEVNEFPPANTPYYITHEGISSVDNANTITLRFNENPYYSESIVNDCANNSNPLEQESIHCHWKAVINLHKQEKKTICYNFNSDKTYLKLSIPDVHTRWSVSISLTCHNLSSSVDLNFELIVKDGNAKFVETKTSDTDDVSRHTSSMILLRSIGNAS